MPSIEDLHAICVRTLSRYIEEAKQTCKFLNEIREFQVSHGVRQEIVQQREAENAAYNKYLVARQNLFEAAQWS